MRRAPGLIELSRRDFCAFACGVALVGCSDSDSSSIVQTGALGPGGDDDGNPIDAPNQPPDDGSVTPDGSTAGACIGTATDCGAPSSFIAGTPKYFSAGKFFVVRDSGGIYALTSSCTHEGATTIVQGSDFYCPRHGAQFTFNGAVVSGPVITGLAHYSACLLPNGNVGVQTSMKVSSSTRLVA
jgi:nitrite reductase/ring-hydroxylating ferredoxin subunit